MPDLNPTAQRLDVAAAIAAERVTVTQDGALHSHYYIDREPRFDGRFARVVQDLRLAGIVTKLPMFFQGTRTVQLTDEGRAWLAKHKPAQDAS